MEEPTATDAGAYPSLALGPLLEDLAAGGDFSVLDLGPASGTTMELLARFGCRVHFVDLFQSLNARGVSPGSDSPRFGPLCAALLNLGAAERLDLILAWDLFNYLSPREMKCLAGVLAPACHAGTELFCLVAIRPAVPVEPFAFSILDRDTLKYEATGPGLRPAPRYPEPALARALPGFRPERAYLLRNGMQEYVFGFRPPASAGGSAPEPAG